MRKKRLGIIVTGIVFVLLFSICTVYAATAPIATSDSYRSGVYYSRLLNALDTYGSSSQIERFVAVALSQEGYKSDSTYGNNSGNGDGVGRYCEYTNPNTIGGYGADWCAAFVSWSARMAGLPEAVVPTTTGAGTFRNVGVQHRLWSNDFSTYQDYQPKKGDIVLVMPYDDNGHYNGWNLTSHVAIVAETSTTRSSNGGWIFTTIERNGNTVGRVTTNTKAVGNTSTGAHKFQMIVTPNWTDPIDSEAPVIHSASASNIKTTGFTVSANITDNIGVNRVRFAVWTPDTSANGTNQDDLEWIEGTKGADGTTWSVNVYTRNHKNEIGCKYWVDIDAYDTSGNKTNYSTVYNSYVTANVPSTDDTQAPVISNVKVTDVSSAGYRVSCTVTDNVGVTRVAFPSWTDQNGQDDLVWFDGTISGTTATAWIDVKNHNNEVGCTYTTHIYAFDAAGNQSSRGVVISVPITPNANSLSVASVGNCFQEVVFTWSDAANADVYDLYIYNSDLSQTLAVRYGITQHIYHVLLPAGSYKAMVCPVNSIYSTWSNSNYVSFTVAEATAGSAGDLVTYREVNHRLFCVYEKDCRWLEAEAIAARDAGTFASITNQAEQDAVAAAVSEFGHACWLGAEAYRNKAFRWVNGDPFSYTNYGEGQPDHGSGYENCLEILSTTGEWNDTVNSGNKVLENKVKGYVISCEPISVMISPIVGEYAEGTQIAKEDLCVNVFFENGLMIETTDFDLVQSGTEAGEQTLTVTYGNLNDTVSITLRECMPAPDFILPSDLVVIEQEAFAGNTMEAVKCPESLEQIDNKAFANCSNLRAIYIPENTTTIARDAFDGCVDMTIWGKAGSVAEAFARARGFEFMEYFE